MKKIKNMTPRQQETEKFALIAIVITSTVIILLLTLAILGL